RRDKVIEKAIDYIWSTAILFRIIKMKIEFVSSGFKVIHEENEIDDFYNNIYKDLDMDTFVKNSSFYYFVVGEWYPYFTWDNNIPETATLLDPTLTEVKTAFGKDFIYLKPSKDILKILNGNDEATKELKKMIPARFINFWKEGKSVYLKNVDRYCNLKEYREQYAHSPLEPIFGDLEIVRSLQEADFATARKLKQLLMHVKVGDQNYNNGQPVPKKVLNDTKEYFENPSKAMEIFIQWFVNVDWQYPPIEIFSNDKYESAVTRILQWSGAEVMFSSDSSYSEGSIRLKGIVQSIDNCRNEIKKSLNKFNKEIALRNGMTYYGKPKIPRIHFDKNALDDPKITSELLKYAYNMGTLSIEKLHDEIGYDFKAEMKKKEDEKEKYQGKQIVMPLFESNQGLLTEDESVSPELDDNKNDQPRP
ncbi:MAG: hypothetical protein ACOC1K_06360, partial [Nanoarchaeota archaeon]